jgi:long-subunit fatty acid transport protein
MKKIKYLLIKMVLILIIQSAALSVLAINELNSTDARSFALGNLCALSRESINPAYLSFQMKRQLSGSVFNQFEMEELNTVSLLGIYPNSFLDASLRFSRYGYTDYQIMQTQTGLAKKILPQLSLGINLIYFRESSILREEAANHLSSDIGIYYQLNKNIELALLGNNVLHTFPDKIWNIHAGISYEPLENCLLLLETAYGAKEHFNLSVGVEYELVEQLKIRAGSQIILKTPSFGVAYQWDKWTIDAGFSLHPVLGLSSIIGFSYRF